MFVWRRQSKLFHLRQVEPPEVDVAPGLVSDAGGRQVGEAVDLGDDGAGVRQTSRYEKMHGKQKSASL